MLSVVDVSVVFLFVVLVDLVTVVLSGFSVTGLVISGSYDITSSGFLVVVPSLGG